MTLLDEAAALGCMAVTLTGGEVALRDDWLDIASAVRERRMIFSVFTNGTLLSDADCRRLASLKPKAVGMSLYASNAEIHDQITGVSGSFTRTVSTARQLRKYGVTCEIKNVLMRENIAYVEQTEQLASELGCIYQFDATVAPRADGDTSVLLHRVTGEALRGFFMGLLDRRRTDLLSRKACDAIGQIAPAPRAMSNCTAGFTSVHIDAYGDVYPCTGFLPAWGNVNAAPLAEIWHGEAATRHRFIMQSPLRPECSACDLRPYCTVRCPRLALVEDGDISGPSSRACEVANIVREMHDRLLAYV